MEMREMTLREFQKMFGQPFVRLEPDGKCCLRMVGTRKPNLVIHLDGLELPAQDDAVVNPFRGFYLPEVLDLMNLNRNVAGSRVGFFRHLLNEQDGSLKPATHLRLVEPENADCVLVTTSVPDSCKVDGLAQFVIESYEESIMSGSSFGRRSGRYHNQVFYELFSLGFRDTGNEGRQSTDDVLTTKAEIIRLANTRLNPVSESAVTDKLIPGLSSQATTLRFWIYEDDLSTEKSWVIDQMGRLLGYSPDLTENCISQFDSATTKIAEFRTWTNVPPDALVLSWCKPSISAKHEFIVNVEPEMLTRAQLERVGALEQAISSAYANRISPYDGCVSPDIGDGWKLWEHSTPFGDN